MGIFDKTATDRFASSSWGRGLEAKSERFTVGRVLQCGSQAYGHDACEEDGLGEGGSLCDWEGRNPFANPAIGLSGFGFLLGWHFMVLFQPVPADGDIPFAEYLIARQIAINISLCVFFLIGGLAISKLPPKGENKSHVCTYAAMALGVLGSMGFMLLAPIGVPFVVASVVLMGASEAMMMLFWLRFYSETSKNYSGQALGMSAIIACVTCYLGFHLAHDVAVVLFVSLPVISGVMLLVGTRGIPLRHNELIGTSVMDWHSAKRPFMKATSQLMVMALCFGLAQGCYTSDTVLLPMTNPATILGCGLAGIVIFLLYSRSAFLPNLTPAINASLVLFASGLLVLPYRFELLSQIGAFLMMTGFICCFLLVLIFVIDLARTFDLNLTVVMGVNQCLEYAMFALGIIAGRLFWEHFFDSLTAAFTVSIVSIYAMSLVVLVFSTERPPWRAEFYKVAKAPKVDVVNAEVFVEKEIEEEPADKPDAEEVVCARYKLTPREIEVFLLLAKGRNAEYIQNALFISNHTVKTHIYNIYRKLGIHSLQELLDIVDREKLSL